MEAFALVGRCTAVLSYGLVTLSGPALYFPAVSRKALWAFGIAVAFFLFYLGVSYSFRYTHVCAHSHQKTLIQVNHGETLTHTIIVCDSYSGNTKHWSPGDPFRALYSEPLTGWNEAIVVVIALAIGAAAFYERWKQRRSKPAT